MSDITLLRLTTGEELVCKNMGEQRYSKIAILIPNGQGGIGIMPWMPYVKGTQDDNGVVISDSVIAFRGEPVDDLASEYNKHFGSGLITPPTKQLII